MYYGSSTKLYCSKEAVLDFLDRKGYKVYTVEELLKKCKPKYKTGKSLREELKITRYLCESYLAVRPKDYSFVCSLVSTLADRLEDTATTGRIFSSGVGALYSIWDGHNRRLSDFMIDTVTSREIKNIIRKEIDIY